MNQTDPSNYQNPTRSGTSGFAIASLVLGIVGIVPCLSPFLIFGLLGIILGHVALSKIKSSDGALAGNGLAVAGLVTGYLGLLLGVGLLVGIGYPNFVKARSAATINQCYNHLRDIDAAKNQWALEHNQRTGAVPTAQDLTPYLKGGVFPVCPSGGTYTIGPVGDDPTCSVKAHTLSQYPTTSVGTAPAPSYNTPVASSTPQSVVATSQAATSSRGVGSFIPASDRMDMVCDSKGSILYITAGGSVLRYQLDTKKFLPPMVLGGDLCGIDISPDNHQLAVADASGGNGRIYLHIVDLQTGNDARASFTAEMLESGTFSVAFGADGQVWFSSSLNGSGFVTLRKYNPQTHSVMKIGQVSQDTMLAASADRQSIAFAEAKVTPGSFGRILYRAVQLPPRPLRSDTFLFEVGISRDGTQMAVPGYQNMIISGSSVPKLDEPHIISAAYHPQKDYLFVAQSGTSLLSVYETANYTKVKELDFADAFQPVNQAFQTGRIKLSPDGKFIFCTVASGIRYAETGL